MLLNEYENNSKQEKGNFDATVGKLKEELKKSDSK